MKLTNSTELDAAAAILHDARFVANEVEWNAGQHTFRLKCWVHISKHKKVPDAGKWKAWILSFSNVETCSVVIKEKVVYYELSRIRYSKDLRTITFLTVILSKPTKPETVGSRAEQRPGYSFSLLAARIRQMRFPKK
jgi:hypothetical protein